MTPVQNVCYVRNTREQTHITQNVKVMFISLIPCMTLGKYN